MSVCLKGNLEAMEIIFEFYLNDDNTGIPFELVQAKWMKCKPTQVTVQVTTIALPIDSEVLLAYYK